VVELAGDRVDRIEHRGVDDRQVAGLERRIEWRRRRRLERDDVPVDNDIRTGDSGIEGDRRAQRENCTGMTESEHGCYLRDET
jgi:hypothetical protein